MEFGSITIPELPQVFLRLLPALSLFYPHHIRERSKPHPGNGAGKPWSHYLFWVFFFFV